MHGVDQAFHCHFLIIIMLLVLTSPGNEITPTFFCDPFVVMYKLVPHLPILGGCAGGPYEGHSRR